MPFHHTTEDPDCFDRFTLAAPAWPYLPYVSFSSYSSLRQMTSHLFHSSESTSNPSCLPSILSLILPFSSHQSVRPSVRPSIRPSHSKPLLFSSHLISLDHLTFIPFHPSIHSIQSLEAQIFPSLSRYYFLSFFLSFLLSSVRHCTVLCRAVPCRLQRTGIVTSGHTVCMWDTCMVGWIGILYRRQTMYVCVYVCGSRTCSCAVFKMTCLCNFFLGPLRCLSAML